MKNFLTTLLGIIIGVGLVWSFVIQIPTPEITTIPDHRHDTEEHTHEIEEALGAFNPAGGTTYRLQTSAGSSDTTVNLSSFKNRSDIPLTMTVLDTDIGYGTLSPQSSRSEFVSFTGITQNANGTAQLTGVSRGLSDIAPFTASTTLRERHPGQSIFILSDSPQLFEEFAKIRSTTAISGQYNFNTVLPSTSLTATTSEQFTNKAYVDSVAVQGSATSTESIGGIVELGTLLEQASSTDNGANQPTVLQTKYATSTPSGTSFSGLHTAIAKTNGKLHQLWFDLTQAFTWTGLHTFSSGFLSNASSTLNATTTISASDVNNNALNLNGVNYAFPATESASSTILSTDGSGSLSWNTLGALDMGKATSTGSVTISNASASDSDTHTLGFRPRQATLNIDLISSGCTSNVSTKGQITYIDNPNNNEGEYYGWRIGSNSVDESDTVLYSAFDIISNDGFTVSMSSTNQVKGKIEINNVTSTGFDVVFTRTDSAGSGCSSTATYNITAIE